MYSSTMDLGYTLDPNTLEQCMKTLTKFFTARMPFYIRMVNDPAYHSWVVNEIFWAHTAPKCFKL